MVIEIDLIKRWFESNDSLTKKEFEKIMNEGHLLINKERTIANLKNELIFWFDECKKKPELLKREDIQNIIKDKAELYKHYSGMDLEGLKEWGEYLKIKEGGTKS